MLGMATTELMKMPGIDLHFVTGVLLQYFLASLRIGAFLLSAPIFGARWLPLKARIIMAFTLAAAIVGEVRPARRRRRPHDPVKDVCRLAEHAGHARLCHTHDAAAAWQTSGGCAAEKHAGKHG